MYSQHWRSFLPAFHRQRPFGLVKEEGTPRLQSGGASTGFGYNSLPAAVQWLSALAWDGLVGLFGAQGVQLFFHVPFAVGVLIVLALEGLVGFLGYEMIHQLETWASAILAVLFVVLSVRILERGHIPLHSTVHGGAAIGAFVLMTTIAFSGAFLGQLRRGLQSLPGKGDASVAHHLVDAGRLVRLVHLDLCDWPSRREGAEQPNSGGCALPRGRGHGWHVGTRHRRLRGDHEQRHE
jgi:hypothetical protein